MTVKPAQSVGEPMFTKVDFQAGQTFTRKPRKAGKYVETFDKVSEPLTFQANEIIKAVALYPNIFMNKHKIWPPLGMQFYFLHQPSSSFTTEGEIKMNALPTELAPSLQRLVDARLDNIDRALLSTDISRYERRQIVSAVEDQIQELVARIDKDEPSREDLFRILASLDPPEAYGSGSMQQDLEQEAGLWHCAKF